MTRNKFRELVFLLVKENKITTLQEFADMFHLANKLPRKPIVKG